MYKRILEAWVAERESKDLQKLPPDFNDRMNEYLEGLSHAEGGAASKLAQMEALRMKVALGELKTIRRGKICQAFLAGALPENGMLDDEGGLFKQAKPPEPEAEEDAKKILARLLRDVPSFVGVDLKTYGPYKGEDVVLLPAQNADALIKRGIAAEIQKRV